MLIPLFSSLQLRSSRQMLTYCSLSVLQCGTYASKGNYHQSAGIIVVVVVVVVPVYQDNTIIIVDSEKFRG